MAAVLLLLASTLTACSVSMVGGLVGGLGGAALLVVVLLGTATTQSGCVEASPCLSMIATDTGPCLSIDVIPQNDAVDSDSADVGPCLSIVADTGVHDAGVDDAGVDDAGVKDVPDVGDTHAPDIDVGPCLSDLGQDTGPCLSIPHDSGSATPDADDSGDGSADGDGKGTASKDTKTGPCLSPPAPDTSWLAPETLQNQADPRAVPSRDAVRRKLAAAGVLPTDLAEKLAKMRS